MTATSALYDILVSGGYARVHNQTSNNKFCKIKLATQKVLTSMIDVSKF